MFVVKNRSAFGHNSYHSHLVATFGVIGAINLFNLAVCVVLFTTHFSG